MPNYQTGRNIAVNYGLESVLGVPPAGGGASKAFRPNSGALSLTKEAIRSNENRRDLQQTRGRHGSRMVGGTYAADLSVGSFDDLIQAALRGTFDTPLAPAAVAVAGDSPTKTFTRATGSWLTDGIRNGDVVRFSGFAGGGVANNNKNFRVTSVTATVMTVAEPVATIASAAGVSVTRSKKCLPGVISRSFTFEEYEADIDASEQFSGCRVGGFSLSLAPNGLVAISFPLVGLDMQVLTGVAAPYFTNPTLFGSIGLASVEAYLRLGTSDVINLTALDLSVNLNAAGQPVIGSLTSPDVFTNVMTVESSATALREDVSRVASFIAEDQLSLHMVFTENEAEPKDFCSFFVGNLTLASATKSELGADGPRTQALTLMIGSDDRGGAYDPGAVKFQTSAA